VCGSHMGSSRPQGSPQVRVRHHSSGTESRRGLRAGETRDSASGSGGRWDRAGDSGLQLRTRTYNRYFTSEVDGAGSVPRGNRYMWNGPGWIIALPPRSGTGRYEVRDSGDSIFRHHIIYCPWGIDNREGCRCDGHWPGCNRVLDSCTASSRAGRSRAQCNRSDRRRKIIAWQGAHFC
jgi:hypothetical protein